VVNQAEVRPVAREPVAAMRALWSALDAAATPASTLATLAALVRTLSASDYGILVIALAASGLSMAVNPAIAATTTKFVSELSGQRHSGGRTVAGLITVSLLAVALIDLVLLLGTAAFNEPLSLWVFGDAVVRTRQVGEVLLLAVLSIGIQQIEAVLAAALRGLERFRRQALIEMLSRAALTAIVVCVAWRTRSLEMILIAQCAVYLASLLVRAVALRRLLPDKRLFDLSGRAQAGALFRYGGWMWLTALAGVAYTSADRIIIGRSLGAASAGQYNIYVQITQLIHFIPSSVFAFSFPAFSRLAAQGRARRDEIAHAYRKYLLAIGVSALAMAAAMMVSWPILMRIIAGAGMAGGRFGAPGLLAVNFVLLACNVASYYLLLALGHARAVSMITTASMLAALVLMTVLIPRYGLEGAALARLAYGVGSLMLLLRAQHLLKRT
jgi:O-antigen/teichoic acid export membrane protein